MDNVRSKRRDGGGELRHGPSYPQPPRLPSRGCRPLGDEAVLNSLPNELFFRVRCVHNCHVDALLCYGRRDLGHRRPGLEQRLGRVSKHVLLKVDMDYP